MIRSNYGTKNPEILQRCNLRLKALDDLADIMEAESLNLFGLDRVTFAELLSGGKEFFVDVGWLRFSIFVKPQRYDQLPLFNEDRYCQLIERADLYLVPVNLSLANWLTAFESLDPAPPATQ